MRRLFLTLGLFFAFGLGSVFANMVIEGFSDAANNRFTNDPASFIGGTLDFSGVARTPDRGRWGTLISPNAALSAHHFRARVGDTYEFYPDNDPNSTPFEAVVTSTLRVGSSDLSIAILDRNVDASIAVYDFAIEPYSGDPPMVIDNPDGTTSFQTFINSDPNEVDIAGARALMFGISKAQNTTATDQAVGENLVLGYSENVVFGSNTNNDTIIFERDAPGSANFLTHETYVQGGDSGAPTFLIDSETNELVLLGVNSFQLDAADPSTFQSSGVTYTGNLKDEINAILEANAIEPVLLGDCNFDEVVNFLDIAPFIATLSVGDYLEQADINQDDTVDFLDISPFINLLSSN